MNWAVIISVFASTFFVWRITDQLRLAIVALTEVVEKLSERQATEKKFGEGTASKVTANSIDIENLKLEFKILKTDVAVLKTWGDR